MVLNLLIQFPIVPAVSFLSYDPKDIIIVIAGFIYGPMTSFIMSLLCSFLEIVFRGGNLLDVLMNVISTCTFACVAACIYKYKHSKKGAIAGLVLGTVCCTLSMTLWNYIILQFIIKCQEVQSLVCYFQVLFHSILLSVH